MLGDFVGVVKNMAFGISGVTFTHRRSSSVELAFWNVIYGAVRILGLPGISIYLELC